jgi:hypothetical protein
MPASNERYQSHFSNRTSRSQSTHFVFWELITSSGQRVDKDIPGPLVALDLK